LIGQQVAGMDLDTFHSFMEADTSIESSLAGRYQQLLRMNRDEFRRALNSHTKQEAKQEADRNRKVAEWATQRAKQHKVEDVAQRKLFARIRKLLKDI